MMFNSRKWMHQDLLLDHSTLELLMLIADDQALYKAMGSHVKKITAVAQNCFNWARNKLKIVDVTIEEKISEWIAPIPVQYLPKQ
jgi:hypothetical protein